MPELHSARGRGQGSVRPVRAGAMTATMLAAASPPSGLRWARVAEVRDGRIVREHLVPPERALRVGHGAECDVSLPDAGFESRPLLVHRDGRWWLRFDEGARGRLGRGPLAELARAAVVGADGWSELPLQNDARGRIEIGGGALLFQLIDRPPARRRPRLPASLEAGWMRQIDWPFTVFVTSSFLLHFALVVFLMEADFPVERGLVPERVAEVIFTDPEPPPVDAPEVPLDPSDGDASDETVADARDDPSPLERADRADRTERPSPGPRRHASRGEATVNPDAAAREALDGVQLALGTLLEQPGSPMADLLREGAPTEDQASVLAQVEGTRVASRDPAAMQERQRQAGCEGCGAGDGLDALAASMRSRRTGTGPVGEGAPVEEVPVVVTAPPVIEDPIGPVVWDPRELHRVLGRRMPAIRRCYEHELTRGGISGGGRLTLTMRVMPVGTLARVQAVDNSTGSEALAACAVRSVRSARVRAGPEAPVEVRYPLVFARRE